MIAEATLTSRGDRGSVSLAIIGLVAVVMVLVLGLGDLGIFLLARSKAQTAADAAALAAAAEQIPGIGRGDPRGEASRFAKINGARLISCECRPGDRAAQVRVAVKVRFGLLMRSQEVGAHARATVDVGRLG